MVEKLFRNLPPSVRDRVLDPGCGTGAFIEGVIRWCKVNKCSLPIILGIDSDPAHVAAARERFAGIRQVEIRQSDFLLPSADRFDFVIGNPPYVPITELSTDEREMYRQRYATAQQRFDLYLLFFEQALTLLKPSGRLVFITPEKFLYVKTGAPLRHLLTDAQVDELHFVDEATFGELVTYPLITTVTARKNGEPTRVLLRDGRVRTAHLPSEAISWLPTLLGADQERGGLTLEDICLRISCGVATGADSVFVVPVEGLDPKLRRFAHPTIAGRDLKPNQQPTPRHVMLNPYDGRGQLLPEDSLGELGRYISTPEHRDKLLARTCVRHKPWYAFHENPPLPDILHPKMLCKDIGATPFFVIDREGHIVPRHSVYYIVPSNPEHVDGLAAYLNSPTVHQWLRDHSQRAAKGFLRLQSHVLKQLPVPATFVPSEVERGVLSVASE